MCGACLFAIRFCMRSVFVCETFLCAKRFCLRSVVVCEAYVLRCDVVREAFLFANRFRFVEHCVCETPLFVEPRRFYLRNVFVNGCLFVQSVLPGPVTCMASMSAS